MDREIAQKVPYVKPEIVSEKVVFAAGSGGSPVNCTKWGSASSGHGGGVDCTGRQSPARS